jgi:hypothetical protein
MDTGEHEGVATKEIDTGPNAVDYSRDRWEGSDVSEAEIEWLYRSRRILEGVACRIPRDEREPVVEPVVVAGLRLFPDVP